MRNKISLKLNFLVVIFLLICTSTGFSQMINLHNIEAKCQQDWNKWKLEYIELLKERNTLQNENKKLKVTVDDLRTINNINNDTIAKPQLQNNPKSDSNCKKELKATKESLAKQSRALSTEKNKNENLLRQIESLKKDKIFLENQLKSTTTIKEYYKDDLYKNENINYQGSSFETFVVNDPKDLEMKIYLRGKNNQLSSLSDLKNKITKEGKDLIFATNGGMYNPSRQPQGFLIINSQLMKPIDKTNPNNGTNFYLKPNGIFYIDEEGNCGVMETEEFAKKKIKPKYATQSGPMLVINGEYHHKLNPSGTSKKIRSGVGVDKTGRVVFAISNQPVNFHTFARLFKNHYKCDNALFLDGTISRMFNKHGKQELGGNFGPIIGVAKRKKTDSSQP